MADTVGPLLNRVEGNMRSASWKETAAKPSRDHRARPGGDVDWHSPIQSARRPGEGSIESR
jgi:hypothetical protein